MIAAWIFTFAASTSEIGLSVSRCRGHEFDNKRHRMIQIDTHNALILKTLQDTVLTPSGESYKLLDRLITDFDFTTYHISTLGESKQLVLISAYFKCWDDLVKYGVIDYLLSKYMPFQEILTILPNADVEQGYNYSLVLDLTKTEALDEETKQNLVDQISLLKRNAMAAPFSKAFARYDELLKLYMSENTYAEEVQQELQGEEVLVIKYRGQEECIYIKPSFDRVTVVFSTLFQDETDKVFGKVFLQEFVDARKRLVQTAPQVLYSHGEPPLDILRAVQGTRADENKGYVTFVLFPRHLTMGDRRENTISHIQFFRIYFHYHIKCSKAYLHSRMRFRVKEFLKILNRAKPENTSVETKASERRTATGRRFDVRA